MRLNFLKIPLLKKYQLSAIFATLFWISQVSGYEDVKNHKPIEFQLSVPQGAKQQANPQREKDIRDWKILLRIEPNNSGYNYQLSLLLIQDGNYAEAEHYLKKALESRPDNVDALLRLSYIYLWEKKYAQAEEGFKKILKTHPEYTDASVGLARTLLQIQSAEEKSQNAPLLAQPVSDQDAKKQHSIAFKLSDIINRQKSADLQRQKEMQNWQTLLKVEPNNSGYNYQLAVLYIQEGNYSEAEKYLKKALESRPDNVDALLRLSYIYLWEQKYAQAEEGFQRILETHPDYTDASEGLARAQSQVKNLEEEKNKKLILAKPVAKIEHEDNVDDLLMLIHEHPEVSDYEYRLGTLYVKDKQYEKAKEHLKKALEIEPKNADALLRLSYIHLWEKDIKTAVEGFEKILKDHPNYTDASAGIKEAQEMQASLEKKPERKRSVTEQARIEHAKEMEKKQLLGEAFSFWYGLFLDYPNDAEYTYNTGKVASWIGKWNLAKKLLYASLDKSQYKEDALIWLGNIYLQLRKWPQAYANLCKVTREAPKRGEGWLALGRTQFKTRRFKAAKKSFSKAYKYINDPQDKEIVRRELFDTRLLVDPSLRFTERYGQELEKDLQTKLEAARRYTWQNEARYQCALTSRIIAYQEAAAGYEREKNLSAGVNNFYVHTYRSTTGMDWFYNPNYKFSVGCTVRKGINEGHPLFYFRNRVVGEPWVGSDFRNVKHIVTCGFLRDSFIYKNFQKNYSAFLLRNNVEALYQYQNFPFGQYIGISGYYRKYKDNIRNDERRGRVWMQTAFPRFQENWVLRYQFEIGGFRRSDTDYYSFRSQWEHIAKLYYWNSWPWLDYAEIGYQRSWRSSRDLNQPINTVFFLPKQFIHTNRVTLVLRKILKQGMDSNFEGLYYWDTAGYKAIAFRADVRWIF